MENLYLLGINENTARYSDGENTIEETFLRFSTALIQERVENQWDAIISELALSSEDEDNATMMLEDSLMNIVEDVKVEQTLFTDMAEAIKSKLMAIISNILE